jgi:hypothetical protein
MANNSIAGFEATAAELQSIINDPKFTKAQIEEAKKLYALNQERYTAFLVQQNSPNLALVVEINGTNEESSPPIVKNLGDGQLATTTPTTATGSVAGTSIDVSNNDLAHACDFATTLQKNNALKRFLRATAAQIRDGIRALLRFLGLGDGSGTVSWIISKLKWLAAEIRYIQYTIIKPIQDFEQVVIAYTQKVAAMISWILSLPSQILALLKDCLSQLQKLVSSIFSDILETDQNPYSEVIAAAKDVASASQSLVQSTVQAAAGAAALPTAVISTALSTPSQSTLAQANTTIANFTASYVSSTPSIQNSTP